MGQRSIGDIVWVPKAEMRQVWETCPDCLGTARWHVKLPNGEEFDCECCRCYHGGFAPSDGRICERWDVRAFAVQGTITAIEVRDGKLAYSAAGYCGFSDADVFDDKESANVRSLEKGKEYAEAEHKRLAELAKSKGRPRKNADGGRAANDMGFGGSSINYARSQVRRAITEAFRWIEFAARKGAMIDIEDVIRKHKP